MTLTTSLLDTSQLPGKTSISALAAENRAELIEKNNYTWFLKCWACFFVFLKALSLAVQAFGEDSVIKVMLALAVLTVFALVVLAATRPAEEFVPSPASGLSQAHRVMYYVLCTTLGILLFYTTGLSFLIAQLLFHLGRLPDDSSWVWSILFPMGASPNPTTGLEVLALGKDLANDVPLFVVLSIALEAFIVCRWLPNDARPRATYSVGDSFLSVMAFVLPLYVLNTLMIDYGKPVYNFVFQNLRLTNAFESEHSVVGFWACLIAADFCYYVFHRASHIMSWLWASHSVHHSSESFNLTNAPREGTILMGFTPATLLDIIPMAFFFPFSVAVPASQVKLVWQVWFHAVLAPPWPTLEMVFNTPSLHRVHHAKNEDRLGKNYGAIFSIWDHLFGTFEPEFRSKADSRDSMYYGIIPVLRTWDVVWLNFQPWYDMFTRQMRFNGLLAPLLHWTPPLSKCPKLGSTLNPREENQKYPISQAWWWYAVGEGLFLAVFGLWVSHVDLPLLPNIVLGIIAFWSLSMVGRLMEGESMNKLRIEVLRQTVIVVGIAVSMMLSSQVGTSSLMYLAAYALLRAALLYVLFRNMPQESLSEEAAG